ncbi:hypothetical protein NUW58_g6667 [Xylaria curta]|uniref:Uncharacterized protein n=1 Tax=Xylaria curta TaxID=42375 RepID=A0ACC1NRU2_9PEZI|nr:hypothetical protein NUW58_g6667 [Xylaria curta]
MQAPASTIAFGKQRRAEYSASSEYDAQSLDEFSSEDSNDVLDLDFDDFQNVKDSEESDLESVNIDDAALEKLPCYENELGVAIPDEEADEEGLFDGNIYPIEFYQQGIANMDIEAYRRKAYARATETQVKAVEDTWCFKHFMIPEIIYDPSLLLSPHVFLLAILYRYRAFETEGLNASLATLNKLRIYPSGNEFPLHLRPDFDNVFIFCRAAKSITGYTISDAPIGYDMMSKWIKRIGVLLGFEHNTISYNLRYMAGNNLDQNVNISDALRNLIMDHAPQSDTFQKHYLNRNVVADLWAIYRNHQPQQALLEQATSYGYSKNSRRPVALTKAQMRAALEGSAKYYQLTARLASLGWGPKFRDQRREITLERDRLRKKLCNDEIKRVREAWARTQFADDIERQIRGESFAHESASPNRDMRPMGTRKPEPEPQGPRTRTRHTQDIQEPESRGKQVDKEQLWRSTFVSTMGKRKVKKCFVCVAKALTLELNDPIFEALCRDFSTPNAAANHFLRIHANSLDEQDTSNCPICQIPLDDKMHLLNHAEGVHGLKTEKRYTME